MFEYCNITQGRPRRDAPTIAPRLLADKLEDELQCELTNSGIRSRTQTTEVSVANGREVVNCTFIGKEVYLIEDIEELSAQLQFILLSYREDFRYPHVPRIVARKSEAAFAHISERVLD